MYEIHSSFARRVSCELLQDFELVNGSLRQYRSRRSASVVSSVRASSVREYATEEPPRFVRIARESLLVSAPLDLPDSSSNILSYAVSFIRRSVQIRSAKSSQNKGNQLQRIRKVPTNSSRTSRRGTDETLAGLLVEMNRLVCIVLSRHKIFCEKFERLSIACISLSHNDQDGEYRYDYSYNYYTRFTKRPQSKLNELNQNSLCFPASHPSRRLTLRLLQRLDSILGELFRTMSEKLERL